MPNPIEGFTVTTPFGRRGDWNCHPDANGDGTHTGDDYSTKGKIGFDVKATKAGKVVIAHVEGGSLANPHWDPAYGTHVVIESGDVRHGYCHLSKILVSVGDQVEVGTRLGLSGNTGNVSGSIGPFFGAHLHYEERNRPFAWCENSRRPVFSRGPGPGFTIDVGQVFLSKLVFGVQNSDSVRRLQDVLNGIALTGTRLSVSGNYGKTTRREVRAWQVQVVGEEPDSPFATGSFPGPLQAKRIFARTGNLVIDDRDDPVG